MLKLENLEIKYKDNVIVDNFDLNVGSGELVAITGPSGSGKTTILYSIGMLHPHSNGTITLFDKENPKFDSKVGRQLLENKLAFVFQNFVLVDNMTVKENLELVVDKDAEFTILEALEFVGLANVMNKKIYELSGGEQQRVAIARALTKKFDLLLGDEITGSLDDDTRDIIFEILKKIQSLGKSIILVTHDIELANKCNMRVRIND